MPDIVKQAAAVNTSTVEQASPVSKKGNGKDHTARSSGSKGPILEPRNPRQWARELLKANTAKDGARLIHLYKGQLNVYRDSRYIPLDARHGQEAKIGWDFLDGARKQTDDGLEPFKPSEHNVKELLSALKSLCLLDSKLDPPFWIGDAHDKPPPNECLAVANGILHISKESVTLIPPTPLYFNLNVSEVRYDPEAKCERWEKFIDEIYPDDKESARTAQEWSGYCLTPDTRQQKVLVLVGESRSGKGTQARILKALIGKENTASLTVQSIKNDFGLQTLIGKQLATLPDAKFDSRDPFTVAERILSISGEDDIPINRKYLPQWDGRLPIKLMILSNEAPSIRDNSAVVVSRFIVIDLKESFLGREELNLEKTLMAELPGILNWAIEGHKRLNTRGRFLQPESARDRIREMEGLASPIVSFVYDRCELREDYEVRFDNLYGRYRTWCEGWGYRPVSGNMFASRLRAVCPGLDRQRRSVGKKRVWRYTGIRLAEDVDDDPTNTGK